MDKKLVDVPHALHALLVVGRRVAHALEAQLLERTELDYTRCPYCGALILAGDDGLLPRIIVCHACEAEAECCRGCRGTWGAQGEPALDKTGLCKSCSSRLHPSETKVQLG